MISLAVLRSRDTGFSPGGCCIVETPAQENFKPYRSDLRNPNRHCMVGVQSQPRGCNPWNQRKKTLLCIGYLQSRSAKLNQGVHTPAILPLRSTRVMLYHNSAFVMPFHSHANLLALYICDYKQLDITHF